MTSWKNQKREERRARDDAELAERIRAEVVQRQEDEERFGPLLDALEDFVQAKVTLLSSTDSLDIERAGQEFGETRSFLLDILIGIIPKK